MTVWETTSIEHDTEMFTAMSLAQSRGKAVLSNCHELLTFSRAHQLVVVREKGRVACFRLAYASVPIE